MMAVPTNSLTNKAEFSRLWRHWPYSGVGAGSTHLHPSRPIISMVFIPTGESRYVLFKIKSDVPFTLAVRKEVVFVCVCVCYVD